MIDHRRGLSGLGLSVALALASLVGCNGSGLTLLVDVRTDYVPVEEFAEVRTEVVRASMSGVETTTSTTRAAGADQDFLGGVRAAEMALAEAGSYRVRVSLLASDGRVVGMQQSQVTVGQGDTGIIVLITRDCAGVSCPAPDGDAALTACLGGRCVDPECRPDNPDACGELPCVGDSDCPARAPCAVGRCLDGACFAVEREGACAEDEWCSVEAGGCVARSESPTDGGRPPCIPEAETCDGADDDCDGSVDEDFDLDTDVAHCGACGDACGADHATAACVGGSCELTCDAGYADCDGDAANGCEASLDRAATCGTCGVTCADPTPLCVSSAGGAFTCESECPPESPTLCGSSCVSTDTSPTHCGACGNDCTRDHASTSCTAGSCALDGCDSGWADCGGGLADGCEADLSSPATCGSCGTSCGGATPYCGPSGTGSYACTDGCSDGVRGGDETDADCGGSLCDPCGMGMACGGDSDCGLGLSCSAGTCMPCGECTPGAMDSRGCGDCGTQTRTCASSCSWGSWSTCSGEGACAPGAVDTQGCGDCGTQTRTCNASCGWNAWGSCTGEGVCSPSAVDTDSCGNCGTRSRTCSSSCGWGGYGACTGEGECAAGATDTSACDNSCQERECSSSCSWGACTGCSCSSFYQCGIGGCPSTHHTLSYHYSSGCPGSPDNQTRCEPNCGSRFYKCGIGGCPSGYHTLSYHYTSACNGSPDNQTRCEQNAGDFYQCGIGGCPTGWHPVSYHYTSACNGSPDNQTRCEPNEGTYFYACGSSCPSGYHVVSTHYTSACNGSPDNQVRCMQD